MASNEPYIDEADLGTRLKIFAFSFIAICVGVGLLYYGVVVLFDRHWPGEKSPLVKSLIRLSFATILLSLGAAGFYFPIRSTLRRRAVTALDLAGAPAVIARGIYRAHRRIGKGIVIWRPNYVALLPAEPIRKTGIIVGIEPVNTIVTFGTDIRLSIYDWLALVIRDIPDQFDDCVLLTVGKCKGIIWRPTEATIDFDAVQPATRKPLRFTANQQCIRLYRRLDYKAQDAARRLSAAWEQNV